MKINSISSRNQLNFKAFKIATITNNVTTSGIDVYELTPKDNTFLKNLASKTDFSKLAPKLTTELQKRWQKVFNYCVDRALTSNNKTYIAIHENKPCGILTFETDKNSINIDGICSIPSLSKGKIPLVGQSLLYQLYKFANNTKVKELRLNAITDGPFNVIQKYKDFGFKQIQNLTASESFSTENEIHTYASMICNKYNLAEQLKKFASTNYYTEIKEKIPQNLNELI